MRIAFGEREIQCNSYEDASLFEQCLAEPGVDSIVLGDDAEGQRAYSVLSVHSARSSRSIVRIGVVASVNGIVLKTMLRPSTQDVWLGFSNRVVVVDTMVPLIKNVVELDSSFYQFLPLRDRGMTLLVHETGLVAVSDGGEQVWQVATDIISSVHLSDDQVVLEFMDDQSITLDQASGRKMQ